MGTDRRNVQRSLGTAGDVADGHAAGTGEKVVGTGSPSDETRTGIPTGVGVGNGTGSGNADDSSAANPEPRTRKRRNVPKPETILEIETSEIIETDPPAKTEVKRKRRAKVSGPKPDGKEAAAGLLEMVELFTVTRFGPEGAFNSTERFCIEKPLARLIEKYGNVAERYGGLIDPIMVLAGVVMYGMRLSAVTQNPPSDDNRGGGVPTPPDPQQPPPNGHANTSYPSFSRVNGGLDRDPAVTTVPDEVFDLFGALTRR